MSTLIFTTGDTAPPINGVIHEVDDPDQVANLTGCSVKFQMRKGDDKRYTVNAAATIVTPAAGTVQYAWATNDLDIAGEYQVQWEITWPDTRTQTTLPDTITVRRA